MMPKRDSVELLTVDPETEHLVPGPKYPRDLGTARYLDSDSDSDYPPVRLAYRHRFFRYDEHGQPDPDSVVEFYVPDWLCDGASPSRRCLALVEQRMGWDRRMGGRTSNLGGTGIAP